MMSVMSHTRLTVAVLAAAGIASGAAAVTTGAATGPTLSISKTIAHRGDKVGIIGRHWGAHKVVTLRVGRPNTDATALIARVTTNDAGAFAGTVPVKQSAAPGRYIIIACRNSCAIKRTKALTILS